MRHTQWLPVLLLFPCTAISSSITTFLLEFINSHQLDATIIIKEADSPDPAGTLTGVMTTLDTHHMMRSLSSQMKQLAVVEDLLTQEVATITGKVLYILLLEPAQRSAFLASLPNEAFHPSHIWLIMDLDMSIFGVKVNFPINSQVYSFHGNEEIFTLYEVYSISPLTSNTIQSYGTWSKEDGLSTSSVPLEERRSDLGGLVLQGQTLAEGPYIQVHTSGGRVDQVTGIIGDIWVELETRLNFTTRLRKPADGQWGISQPNGTWTGIVGAVARGEADVGLSSFFITLGRSQVVAFSPGIMVGIER